MKVKALGQAYTAHAHTHTSSQLLTTNHDMKSLLHKEPFDSSTVC